jgi:hypothetical protein
MRGGNRVVDENMITDSEGQKKLESINLPSARMPEF